jgi:curved DNA-binding protein CbpA
MKMDYYELLELSENCSREEIKKQYHKLSKIYHPDKNNGDDTTFKEIKEAYDILYDDEHRKKHNIQRIFKGIDFTEEEYELFNHYYQNFIHSNENII